MGIVAILFNVSEPFEQFVNTLSIESVENWSNGFRKEGVYMILYQYIAQRQGQITPRAKLIVFTFIIYCKFQP